MVRRLAALPPLGPPLELFPRRLFSPPIAAAQAGFLPTESAVENGCRANRADPLGPHRPAPRRNHPASLRQPFRRDRPYGIVGGADLPTSPPASRFVHPRREGIRLDQANPRTVLPPQRSKSHLPLGVSGAPTLVPTDRSRSGRRCRRSGRRSRRPRRLRCRARGPHGRRRAGRSCAPNCRLGTAAACNRR